MAFGQQSGPPAPHRQVEELLALVIAAGHDGFREARHPLGLTQRQAGGKFTRDEAQALIDQLLASEEAAAESAPPARAAGRARPRPRPARPAGGPVTTAERRAAQQSQKVRDVPSEILAGELQRRGWAVIEP